MSSGHEMMSGRPLQQIEKAPGQSFNLDNYEALRAGFSWTTARQQLEGLPGGGLNIAHEAVIRHARGTRAGSTALLWLGRHGERREISYRELGREVARFANMLRDLGVQPGERVFVMLGRVPELYIAVLGSLLARAVVSPLFSAFGPEPVATRVSIGQGRLLVTSPELYARKIATVRNQLPTLQHVLVTGEDAVAGTSALAPLLASASDQFETPATDPEDMALLHFTSGTTGAPKGAIHVHEAVVAHHITGHYALDLRPGDVFWCTADPGWVTGTSYGIIAPLTNGATNLVLESEFDVALWYKTLESEKVNVWYTAPTAIRRLMKAGPEAAQGHDLSHLRFMASVGEPLNPEAVIWGQQVLGQPFHDNWWQTETGGIMIANFAALPVKPGSMGRPIPGIEAAIARRGPGGEIELVEAAGVEGELVIRSGWPSMMRGYLGEEARYRKCFARGWYLTGDLARRDEDGCFWFVGRADDVIKTSGHLIGPFEVESVLIEHPAVAEAAVIGVPDATAGELVKAFVALKTGYEPDEALRRSILGHARQRLGPAVAPKLVDFRADLPKTRSGKIMRRLLKARELGLPEGDLSTLEGEAS
jgi:acetyl-CoA synthetase